MPASDPKPWNFLPHPDAERFDHVEIETVPRWKSSGLSGDEYRFSYRAIFYSHGRQVASVGGRSVQDALLKAAAAYDTVKKDEGVEGGYYGNLDEVCCQPGCPDPWTVLYHPKKRYDKHGGELVRPMGERDVRGFCERHRHRGDCALDDADDNYEVVEERFPPDWSGVARHG